MYFMTDVLVILFKIKFNYKDKIFLLIKLNFNMGYFEKGVIVKKRKKIVFRYLKKGFVTDIVSIGILLFQFLAEKYHLSDYTRYFFLLYYIKGNQFKDIIKRLETRFQLSKN